MGKRIIDIVKGESRKQKVLIDGEPIYYLFSKNIKSLKLFIGKDLDDEVLVMIKDIVVKRGLSYCYHLIAKKDFTTHEINQKLSKALYDDESIEIILNKLTDMKLLDDESYTKRYLESYLAHKSKKWIEHKLYLKGIKNFDYADTMDSMEVVINAQKKAIETAIRKWLRQKKNRPNLDEENINQSLFTTNINEPNNLENNEGDSARNNNIYNSEDEWTRDYMNKGIDKQKLIQHLYQKGFEYVLIQEIISRNL